MKLNFRFLNVILFFSLIGFISKSCKHDPVEVDGIPAQVCDTIDVSYSADIVPVLQSNCTNCHSGSAPQGGINLSEYSQVRVYAENGKLFGSINHEPGFSSMPPSQPKLPSCTLKVVKAWIDQGIQNN